MKKYIAILVALILATSSFCAFAAFDDIDDATLSWAGDAINSLTQSGVINGYEDGTFKPLANVTRSEFAKMVAVAFELDKSGKVFDDIIENWAKDYIVSVGDLMYTEGTVFEPDKYAAREDIAYCIAGVLDLKLNDKDFAKKYSDYKDIHSAMQTKVSAAAENGIMIGYEDLTLRPKNPVTRAEAAVIIHRALEFKKEVENPQEPVLPPDTEEEETIKKDHLYNLYPGKELILVVSVNLTADGGEDAYKITYKLADGKETYTSVVPEDTAVTGIKNNISALSAGDVLIMDTAFLGHIGSLHVFASFGGGSLNFDNTITGYAKGDYTLSGGKIKEIKQAGKNLMVTLESGGTENSVFVSPHTEANVFSSWKKGDKWSYGFMNDVDPLTEEEYAFIRFTNGVATDIIISDFIR